MSHTSQAARSFLIVLFLALAGGVLASEQAGVIDRGMVGLTVTNMGRLGNAFSNRNQPSCEYPFHSNIEHLYLGGLWVGARTAEGDLRVSISGQDVAGLYELQTVREFADLNESGGAPSYRFISNVPIDDFYSVEAIAPAQIECLFHDGVSVTGHVPLGVKIKLRALAWTALDFDDFVILEYTVTNISAGTLRDVYVGFFNDTTVGNTDYRTPYDPQAANRWDYFDDLNGAWRPGDFAGDPSLWMMHEHDGDGDQGLATSWVGCRLLGTEPHVAAPLGLPPVSYNCWRFRRGPQQDNWYTVPTDPATMLPGKYQVMSNGDFDIGVTPAEDYTVAGNRVALLSTGPFLTLPPNESVRVTFALTLGFNETVLRYNSRYAQLLYDYGYHLPMSGVGDAPGAGTTLGPVVPNPFNPAATVHFELSVAGAVRLAVYDLAGRLVRTLVHENLQPGSHEAVWDGRDSTDREVGSGSYLARLEFGGKVETVRMLLVR